MNTYDFHDRLAFSTSRNGRPLGQVIAETIPGVVRVVATDVAQDKTGVDYIAHLRRGAQVFIDLKMRDRGCGQFWDGEEDLALEIWSVIPEDGFPGKRGWTLDEAKATHYTLHAFDPSDSARVFILPFQLLRKAFRAHFEDWGVRYRHAIQDSGRWRSECLFVPVSVVLTAINEAMIVPAKNPVDTLQASM